MKYDYLIVGAGLTGCMFGYLMSKKGKKCLIIDKRNVIGGNVRCENIKGIEVHKYGAHIFRTDDKKVWNMLNKLAEFNNFINSPIANYKGKIYNLPFNMNTFKTIWKDVVKPEDAKKHIEKEKYKGEVKNLEQHAKNLVGKTIYKKLIKDYTEKQWGKKCKDLSPDIMKRIPLRFTYNNNYFNQEYQGIPKKGYNYLFEKLTEKCDIKLNEKYNKLKHNKLANKILYTGALDEYFNYCYGELEWRSLKFENKFLSVDNYQGNAVVNYTSHEKPFTRIIEHKHFEFGKQEKTVISREYSSEWKLGDEPYYPINNDRNNALYLEYRALADKTEGVIFGGRLGQYKYYDMDKVIISALDAVKAEFGE